MSVKVDFPRAELGKMDAAMRRVLTELKRDAGKVLKSQLRLLAVDFAFSTEPFDKTAQGRRELEKTIEGRIRAIYKPVGEMHNLIEARHGAGVADAFVKLVRRRQFSEAERMLAEYPPLVRRRYGGKIRVGEFDGGDLAREARRRKRGLPMLVVPRYPEVNRFIREEKRKAGHAKSAFARAAEGLGGTRGIPAWVVKGRGRGRGAFSGSLNKIRAVIEAHPRYMRQALSRSREKRTLRYRSQAILKALKRIQSAPKYRRKIRT